jgi:hypothetical protein
MDMAVGNSELDNLAQWDDLAFQLTASALAQGRSPTPRPPPPAPAPPPAPHPPLHWPFPWAPPVYIDLFDDDNDN